MQKIVLVNNTKIGKWLYFSKVLVKVYWNNTSHGVILITTNGNRYSYKAELPLLSAIEDDTDDW